MCARLFKACFILNPNKQSQVMIIPWEMRCCWKTKPAGTQGSSGSCTSRSLALPRTQLCSQNWAEPVLLTTIKQEENVNLCHSRFWIFSASLSRALTLILECRPGPLGAGDEQRHGAVLTSVLLAALVLISVFTQPALWFLPTFEGASTYWATSF